MMLAGAVQSALLLQTIVDGGDLAKAQLYAGQPS